MILPCLLWFLRRFFCTSCRFRRRRRCGLFAAQMFYSRKNDLFVVRAVRCIIDINIDTSLSIFIGIVGGGSSQAFFCPPPNRQQINKSRLLSGGNVAQSLIFLRKGKIKRQARQPNAPFRSGRIFLPPKYFVPCRAAFGYARRKTFAGTIQVKTSVFLQKGIIRYNNRIDLSIPKVNKKIIFCIFC